MWTLLCTDRAGQPFFVVDEAGQPALYETEEEAEASALQTPVCLALGWVSVQIPPVPPPL